MLSRVLMITAASLAIGGCSTVVEYGSVRKESLVNEQGHVVGYKEILRNTATGETLAQVAYFKPVLGAAGELIGYEEQTKDGALIRDFNGRAIGSRWSDMRSRSTNARSRGITVVFRPSETAPVASAPTKMLDLMASLSPSELRRIQ